MDLRQRGLLHAISSSDATTVAALLELEPTLACRPVPTDPHSGIGRRPLHVAATCGDRAVVELLLAHGAEIDACDLYGQRPLHLAAQDGSVAVVEALVLNGAALDVTDEDGCTPLQLAAALGRTDVVRLLLAHGATPEEGNPEPRTAT